MITLNWFTMNGQIGALMGRFHELPRHIAKKHLKAAIRRGLREGVPILKKLTPKGKSYTYRQPIARNAQGRFLQGSGKKMRYKAGGLRRSVATKAKYIGKNKNGVVYGTIGYRAGPESRKGLWLEFGTNRIKPRQIMDRFRSAYRGPMSKLLVREMRNALEKAARELESGMNPTRTFR